MYILDCFDPVIHAIGEHSNNGVNNYDYAYDLHIMMLMMIGEHSNNGVNNHDYVSFTSSFARGVWS